VPTWNSRRRPYLAPLFFAEVGNFEKLITFFKFLALV